MSSIVLTCHPSSPCETIRRFDVKLRAAHGELALEYALEGDIGELSIPAPAVPHRADGLWRSTCFEVFVKVQADAVEYHEFNFSPSIAWASYRFNAYRQGMAVAEDMAVPKIVVRQDTNRFDLDVFLTLDSLTTETRLAVSAVIQEKSGRLSYWAYKHPPGKPDFHHPDSFAFQLGEEDIR